MKLEQERYGGASSSEHMSPSKRPAFLRARDNVGLRPALRTSCIVSEAVRITTMDQPTHLTISGHGQACSFCE
jgi:hypothetical protein